MISESTDAVVIGAGVVGLAVARALARAGRDVIVLESNSAIGQETSSRNSEVIHAGIYYQAGSLKAKTCVKGKELLYDYCQSRGIPHRAIGKLIVACNDSQLSQLQTLLETASKNGVNDLRLIDRSSLAELEPSIRAEAALLSPSTGIIDSHALMLALQADIEAAGGSIVTNSRVTGGYSEHRGLQLQVVSGGESWLHADFVVNSTGLAASHVARSIPDVPEHCIPQTFYVKGQYFSYAAVSPFSHLVYPLPDQYSLGVHATLDQAGQLKFGPDANYCPKVDYTFDEGRQPDFANSIRQWFPDLDEKLLRPAYTGIRPKISGPDENNADFYISGPEDHGINGLVNLFGIESPGLTACLALADEVLTTLN